MKKIAPIVAIALIGTMFTSCKKNYTCTCTALGITVPHDLGKQKKKDAKDACDLLNTSAAVAGGSCSLD